MKRLNHTRLEKQLRGHESYRKHPYRDTEGVLTVGYGRNLDANGVSRGEARFMLKNDLAVAEGEAKSRFPFFKDLDSIRQEVLVNMMYNLGWPRLKTFVKMIAALKAGDYGMAAAEMLDSKWHSQVKGRAEELAEQMRTGSNEEKEE